MTKKEAKKLNPSDTVQFSDGIRGIVRECNKTAVKINWSDGQLDCWIDHEDMSDVTFIQAGAATAIEAAKKARG